MRGEHPEKRYQSQRKPADERLPFLAPDAYCNARLARGPGYCRATAGQGTNHVGVGRCRIHGGLSPKAEGADGPREHMIALGLGAILHLAETMTQDDEEYLYHVGNAAAVAARASIIQRMNNPDASAKELADLTIALQRLDTILSKYPHEDDPDQGANTPGPMDEELARLVALEEALGTDG